MKLSKSQVIRKFKKLDNSFKYSVLSNFYYDFLPTCNNVQEFGETDKYFFKEVNILGRKELRFFKSNGRVTMSKKRTIIL